jgi:hypothetical protein
MLRDHARGRRIGNADSRALPIQTRFANRQRAILTGSDTLPMAFS